MAATIRPDCGFCLPHHESLSHDDRKAETRRVCPADSMNFVGTKESAMSTSDWRDLKDKFLGALEGKPVEGSWLDVWRLFLEHPWYQEQLDLCAQRVLRRAGCSRQLLGDVKQDAMLLLARKLRKTPDLHIDHQRAEEHFPGWMETIITRDCLEALRRIRRRQPLSSEAVSDDQFAGEDADIDSQIDFSLLLDQFPDPERTIVTLYAKGWNVTQIAAELGLDYGKARRLLRRGLALVAEKIGAAED